MVSVDAVSPLPVAVSGVMRYQMSFCSSFFIVSCSLYALEVTTVLRSELPSRLSRLYFRLVWSMLPPLVPTVGAVHESDTLPSSVAERLMSVTAAGVS